jgi:hypothetical protein
MLMGASRRIFVEVVLRRSSLAPRRHAVRVSDFFRRGRDRVFHPQRTAGDAASRCTAFAGESRGAGAVSTLLTALSRLLLGIMTLQRH